MPNCTLSMYAYLMINTKTLHAVAALTCCIAPVQQKSRGLGHAYNWHKQTPTMACSMFKLLPLNDLPDPMDVLI